jgi:hypothetical protein
MNPDLGEIILYQSEDGTSALDVHLKDETVWLTQAQMVELFQRDKRTISEHIRNVFKEGELIEAAVVRDFRTTAADGKTYRTNFYNLDGCHFGRLPGEIATRHPVPHLGHRSAEGPLGARLHPQPSRQDLAARGIAEVFRCQRITLGKFRNFTVAVPV